MFKDKCQSYTSVCDGFWEYLQQNYLRRLKLVDFSYSSLNSTLEPKELIEMGRRIRFSGLGDYLATDTTPLYDINVFRNGKFEKVTVKYILLYRIKLARLLWLEYVKMYLILRYGARKV